LLVRVLGLCTRLPLPIWYVEWQNRGGGGGVNPVDSIFTYSCERSHTNTNTAFRLVNPVYGMHTYMCKVHVFTKQAKYE